MSENTVTTRPWFQTAHAQITEPTRFVAVSQYYRKHWLKCVGPVGTAILIELRGRCYHNPSTGELRDTVAISQREIADAIGISVDTLQRQIGKAGTEVDLKANQALRRFIWVEERFERGQQGHVRQLENVYHVSMDDPVHPDDEEKLEALMREYEQREAERLSRKETGKKQIIASVISERLTKTPEPQNAVLRTGSKDRPAPEPHFAEGGYRILRQGLPQNAVDSKESLLFFTQEITPQTLNVEESINSVDAREARLERAPLSSLFASASADPLDRQVTALVEELQDWGSERRHRQLISLCEQHGLTDLPTQALHATRQRQSREGKRGPIAKPGAYYAATLLKLLEQRQVFVPAAEEKNETLAEMKAELGLPDGATPEQMRQALRASMGMAT